MGSCYGGDPKVGSQEAVGAAIADGLISCIVLSTPMSDEIGEQADGDKREEKKRQDPKSLYNLCLSQRLFIMD